MTNYPDALHIPRCLLGILKVVSFQHDTATMVDAYNKILSKYGRSKMIVREAALVIGEFYNKQAQDCQNALNIT